MSEYVENLKREEATSSPTLKPKRGRPSVNVSWPENDFTAEEVYNALEKKLSRVSVHAKINQAIKRGELKTVGKLKPRTGRPKMVYRLVTPSSHE